MATVALKEGNKYNWYRINQKGEKLFKVFPYDNGPDYFVNGRARIIENGRMGFCDPRGKKVVAAKFDWVSAFAFSPPVAVVCKGCKMVPVHSKNDGRRDVIIKR